MVALTEVSDSTDIRVLRLLTAERLTSYIADTTSVSGALRLYEWNIEASAAVLSLCAMVEVVVRNALDEAMSTWAALRHPRCDWFTVAPIDGRGKADVEHGAHGRVEAAGPTPTGTSSLSSAADSGATS
jgi:hypothetical protein